MSIQLYDYQLDAIKRMRNGCILCGGVGTGKSRTALSYYYINQGGDLSKPVRKEKNKFFPDNLLLTFDYTKMESPKDLYIITTARKRDTLEWDSEMGLFLISSIPESHKLYKNKIIVDSWNNISKYSDIKDSFFIFDEQRVVGSGTWVNAFLKIAKNNDWILLSATPGDTWSDYIPVFLANGFYRNKTEFAREHIVYSRFTKYPSIDRYINTGRLIRLRDRILIDMEIKRRTVSHHEDLYCSYDISKYKRTIRERVDPYKQAYILCDEYDEGALLVGFDIDISEVDPIMDGWQFEPENGMYVRLVNKPIQTASELCYILRKIVNSDESRQIKLLELFEKHPKLIVFYNFTYELDILKNIYYGENVEIAEWNGQKHQEIPSSEKWVYLVQWTAGAEGWNCIKTDTIVFYSQNYSFKMTEQARGRIDRLNSPYTDLFYYYLKSRSGIDLAISKALTNKKKFNERKFAKWD